MVTYCKRRDFIIPKLKQLIFYHILQKFTSEFASPNCAYFYRFNKLTIVLQLFLFLIVKYRQYRSYLKVRVYLV